MDILTAIAVEIYDFTLRIGETRRVGERLSPITRFLVMIRLRIISILLLRAKTTGLDKSGD